jgi:peptidoglycan/xylan/chitin deacetylase (PgdA/CDA1 family)
MQDALPKRVFRTQAKTLWALLLRVSGLLGIAKKWIQRNGTVVLTFHRVLTDEELRQTGSLLGMIVRAETFDSFLRYASQNYEIVDLAEELEWHENTKLRIALTFDDGWSDSASRAFPIAQQRGAPLTIFIVPERTGQTLPFWPELASSILRQSMNSADRWKGQSEIEQFIESLKELPAAERKLSLNRMIGTQTISNISAPVDTTMTWEQVGQLQARGVTFGSHTCTHEILTCIPLDRAEQEITVSRGLIEQRLGATCSLFSYPNGNCSPAVRNLVAKAGYSLAFLNQTPGVWTRDCDPFLVPRVNVCEHHLVNTKDTFSPLIFEYAVLWKAARRLLSDRCASLLAGLSGKCRDAYRTFAWKPERRSP